MDPHTNNDERSSMYQVEEEEEDNNSTSETSTSPTEDCEDVETVKTATAASSGMSNIYFWQLKFWQKSDRFAKIKFECDKLATPIAL